MIIYKLIPNIYAIGDVVRGDVSTKAEEEGSMVAEVIAGQKPSIYNLILVLFILGQKWLQ
jgi:pyruvate/2-oxoglutarate dehydrogenase complex dihydrolipoamide dehydrogenase (E3) component